MELWSIAIALNKVIFYCALFGTSGLMLFLQVVEHLPHNLIKTFAKQIIPGGFLTLFTASLHIALQAGFLSDNGLTGMLDHQIIQIILSGPNGAAFAFQVFGTLLILVSGVAIFFTKLQVSLIIGCLGCVIAAMSFSLVGHTSNEPRLLMTALITFHVLIAFFWFGALLAFETLTKQSTCQEVALIAHDFSKKAMLSVPVLVVAGLTLSVFLVASFSNLFTTSYGLLLILKVGTVAGLLFLGSLNKFVIVPSIAREEPTALESFQRTCRIEIALMIVVFSITAFLTTSTSLPHIH